uniref:Integrase catalytic domain-containing protein n=1 Tax=Trichuris muris TaxID=70415 RepID=A0A5S6R4F6_TRIMR
MRATCKQVVESCPTCQRRKILQTKPAGYLHSVEPLNKPFQVIGLDHLGPFPRSGNGNKHVIVCIDYLSKWVEAKAVPDTSTEEVARFLLNDVVLRHGTPTKVVTYRGTAFTSTKMADILVTLGIQHGMTTAYHPQSNGLTEKANRTLTGILAPYVNETHRDWDNILPFATFAMNTAKQESTKLSPFELIYGRQAVLPEESRFPWPMEKTESYEAFRERVERWRKDAKGRIIRSQRKQKVYYDRRRR